MSRGVNVHQPRRQARYWIGTRVPVAEGRSNFRAKKFQVAVKKFQVAVEKFQVAVRVEVQSFIRCCGSHPVMRST